MSILSDFEDRIGRAVEGGFARVFRSPVQPAELAHRIGREMDRRKVVGVGKIYAPTLYNVLLSPEDDAQLGGFADTLAGELETYLVGYARERSYALTTRPVVRFLVDAELRLGRFDVIGELLSAEEMAAELGEDLPPEPHVPPAHTDLAEAIPPVRAEVYDAAEEFEPAPTSPALSTVTVRGVDHDVVLRGERIVVGRLSSCDICLSDANASRQHAAFVRDGAGWAIEDLGSTNGTLLNGSAVEHARLRDGDTVVVGITELVYHEPRGLSA